MSQGKCEVCGKGPRTVHRHRIKNKLMCRTCARKEDGVKPSRGTCELCGGKNIVVHVNRETGLVTCTKCFRNARFTICRGCGLEKIIQANGLCDNCYRIDKGYANSVQISCDRCGKRKRIVRNKMCKDCLRFAEKRLQAMYRRFREKPA